MSVIARVYGTALRPGVSRNDRLYTKALIAKAVSRVQERIASPDGMPVTMRTHHAADDDSLMLVGHLTGMTLAEDGSARYTAVIADTPAGRSIAALAEDHDGKPVLKGVSIRGAWLGKPRRERVDGRLVETGDDMEIDGLDYTARPGVAGAQIDRIERVAGTPTETVDGGGRVLITESVQEALVETISEAGTSGGDGKRPYGDVPYADPGYQKDKQKRYPIDTKAHAKSAWSYVNQADNARLYSSAQLKRIKQRIRGALGKFGVAVAAQEGWLIEPAAAVTEALAEYYGMDPQQGTVNVCLSNGQVTVTVCSYCVDPHDLDLIGRAAMDGACQALAAIDPDMDGDMDVPGADAGNTDRDRDMEAAPGTAGAVTEAGGAEEEGTSAPPDPTDPADSPDDPPETGTEPPAPPVDADSTDREEPAVSEPTNPAADAATPQAPAPATPPGITFTDEQFRAFLDRLAPAPAATESAAPVGGVAEHAPAAPAASPAAPVTPAAEAPAAPHVVQETDEERIGRIVAERIAAERTRIVQEMVESGNGPSRKGLVAPVAESATQAAGQGEGLNEYGVPADWPAKPLHQYTPEERRRYFNPALQQHVLGDRAKS